MNKGLGLIILGILCLSLIPVFAEIISFSGLSGKKNVSISYSKPYFLIYKNFSTVEQKSEFLLVPSNVSLNFTLNQSLSENEEVILNLTNLRTSSSLSGKITANDSFWYIPSNNLSFGQYLLKITPNNFSSNRNFSLLVYLYPKFAWLNFSEVRILSNGTLENQTSSNLSFYVDNTSESKIEILFGANQSTSDINLTLYFPNGTIANSTLTTNGNATLFYDNRSNFPSGYWKVEINNTNQTASFTYNLTVILFGSNISFLGNISENVSVEANFSFQLPEAEILPGEYYSKVIIMNGSGAILKEEEVNTTKKAPTLLVKNGNFTYIKFQSLKAGWDGFSTLRDLFLNINQTKNITLRICNDGNENLSSLSEKNSSVFSNGVLYLNFSVFLPETPITLGSCKNLTIQITKAPENKSYLGNFSGWILLSSSDALPYSEINLTLNITVVNETMPELRLNNCSKQCFVNLGENATFTLYPYYYDGRNLMNLTNATINLSIVGPTNLTITLEKQPNLIYQNSTIFTQLGSYLAKSIFISQDGNEGATGNLSFSVVDELNFNVTQDNQTFNPGEKVIIKFQPLFKDNSPDPFNLNLTGNVTLSISVSQETKTKELSGNLDRIGNSSFWNLSFSIPPNFVGGWFQGKAEIRDEYNNTGNLEFWIGINNSHLEASVSGISSELDLNETDEYKVTIRNYGLKAANVSVSLHVCDSLDITDDSEKTATVNSSSYQTLAWKVKAKKEKEDCEVYFTILGGTWWPNQSSYTTPKKKVDIVKEEEENSGNSQSQQQEYTLYFTKPTSNEIEVVQGLNKTIEVEVSNLGTGKVHDLYLKIVGLDSSWYSISPSSKSDLAAGKEKTYTIKFSIPVDATPKEYEFTLKAISEEKTISRKFYLKVLEKPGIGIEGLPSQLSVIQGQKKSFKLKVKNLGDVSLHNLSISLEGVEYEISPKGNLTLEGGKEREFNITLCVGEAEEIGVRTISVNIKGDENEITTSFKLTILPSEKTKKEIRSRYEKLLSEYLELYSKFANLSLSEDSTTYKNLTELFSQANDTLQKAKESLNNEDYFSAKNYLASVGTTLEKIGKSLSSLENQRSEAGAWSILPYLLLFIALGIGGLLAYLYHTSTKPGFRIGEGYVFRRKENFLDELKEKVMEVIKEIKRKIAWRRNI